MTRNEIIAEFNVNEHGTISDPGKFEGEPIYAPYFYDVFLNGCQDDDIDGVLYFDITAEDRIEFPELAGAGTVTLYIDDQGFVNSSTFAEAGFREESEEEESEEEESEETE